MEQGYASVRRRKRKEGVIYRLNMHNFSGTYDTLVKVVDTLNWYGVPKDNVRCSQNMRGELEKILKDNLDK